MVSYAIFGSSRDWNSAFCPFMKQPSFASSIVHGGGRRRGASPWHYARHFCLPGKTGDARSDI